MKDERFGVIINCCCFVFFQLDDAVVVVKSLSNGKMKWADVESKYPKFEQQEATSGK